MDSGPTSRVQRPPPTSGDRGRKAELELQAELELEMEEAMKEMEEAMKEMKEEKQEIEVTTKHQWKEMEEKVVVEKEAMGED